MVFSSGVNNLLPETERHDLLKLCNTPQSQNPAPGIVAGFQIIISHILGVQRQAKKIIQPKTNVSLEHLTCVNFEITAVQASVRNADIVQFTPPQSAINVDTTLVKVREINGSLVVSPAKTNPGTQPFPKPLVEREQYN